MADSLSFRLLVARTDTDEFCAVGCMDKSVVEAAGEEEWDEAVKQAREDWPEEYEFATVTATIPAEQVAPAFPTVVEVEGEVVVDAEA